MQKRIHTRVRKPPFPFIDSLLSSHRRNEFRPTRATPEARWARKQANFHPSNHAPPSLGQYLPRLLSPVVSKHRSQSQKTAGGWVDREYLDAFVFRELWGRGWRISIILIVPGRCIDVGSMLGESFLLVDSAKFSLFP